MLHDVANTRDVRPHDATKVVTLHDVRSKKESLPECSAAQMGRKTALLKQKKTFTL